MRRRSSSSIVANPVLVGAVTSLVVVVAVFLAYNANNGLPFVPTRELKVQLANGSNLVKGNEVRSGGFRVGVVTDMLPVRLRSGRVGAQLVLKLDKKVGAIPVDSSVLIRPRSALGLKYVELTTGRSKQTIPDGGTLPVSQSRVPVDIDDVYNTFDRPTRVASSKNLRGFGDALVGRGRDLNTVIAAAPSLFGHLAHVTRNLADPRTQLAQLFQALDRTVDVLAPVSRTQAHLFTTMADTFAAISKDPRALQQTIEKGPDTLAVGTRSLRVNRPFLADTAAFSHDLRGATAQLRPTLPTLNRALAVGTPVTRRSVALYTRLDPALDALRRLATAPTTGGALRGLTATVTTLQPQLRFLGPYVTVCNHWNSFWTFAAEHLSAPDDTGSQQRVLLNTAGAPVVNGNDGVGGSTANEFDHAEGEQLHAFFQGSAIDPQGNANCETGQQGYVRGRSNPYRDRSHGDPYRHVAVDHPNLAGVEVGPNYKQFDRDGKGISLDPAHVPAGETFTWRPGGTARDTPDPATYPDEGK